MQVNADAFEMFTSFISVGKWYGSLHLSISTHVRNRPDHPSASLPFCWILR